MESASGETTGAAATSGKSTRRGGSSRGKSGKALLDPLRLAGRTLDFAAFQLGDRNQFLEIMSALLARKLENGHLMTSWPLAR